MYVYMNNIASDLSTKRGGSLACSKEEFARGLRLSEIYMGLAIREKLSRLN